MCGGWAEDLRSARAGDAAKIQPVVWSMRRQRRGRARVRMRLVGQDAARGLEEAHDWGAGCHAIVL